MITFKIFTDYATFFLPKLFDDSHSAEHEFYQAADVNIDKSSIDQLKDIFYWYRSKKLLP